MAYSVQDLIESGILIPVTCLSTIFVSRSFRPTPALYHRQAKRPCVRLESRCKQGPEVDLSLISTPINLPINLPNRPKPPGYED